MPLRPRSTLILGAALLLPACGDKSTGEDTSSSTTAPATTGEPDPTTSTGTPTTTDPSSSSGDVPAQSCLVHANEAACAADPLCQWEGVVQYTHGAQGCAGSITQFCLEASPAGGPSAWYRGGTGNDAQVVEFDYTPQNLDPEWTECGCDGPLACLCTSVSPVCPERSDEFCGAIATKEGCDGAFFKELEACAWATISNEGPADMDCSDTAEKSVCLPATDAGEDTCAGYVGCPGQTYDIFWREVAGEIEVTTLCGPTPVGWTRCEADDTPGQPTKECECRCL